MSENKDSLRITKLVEGIFILFFTLSLACLIIGILFKEDEGLMNFLFSTLLFGILILICHFTKKFFYQLRYSHYHLFILWSFASLLSSVPFLFYCSTGHTCGNSIHLSILDSFFEGTSGITSTGFSMLENPHKLPKQLQLWRSSIQWVGGLGLVVWISHFYSKFKSSVDIFSKETFKLKERSSFKSNVKKVSALYISSTIILCILLMYELPYWEAINHSLSIMATGGFSLHPDSFSRYSSSILIITSIFMIFSSLNFPIVIEIIEKRSLKKILKNKAFIQFLLFIIIGYIAASVFIQSYSLKTLFNVISASTTTGLSAEPMSAYSPILFLLLSNLMFIGGMVGSTAGGLKQENLLFLFRHLFNEINFFNKKDVELDNKRLKKMLVTLFMWVLVCVVFIFILSMIENSQYLPSEILFNIISALSNCGLSTEIISQSSTTATKIIFIFLMLVGRLSFFSILSSLLFFTKIIFPYKNE